MTQGRVPWVQIGVIAAVISAILATLTWVRIDPKDIQVTGIFGIFTSSNMAVAFAALAILAVTFDIYDRYKQRQYVKVDTVNQVKDLRNTVPTIIFVVTDSWISQEPRTDVPLKLYVGWANEGIGLHIGKPRWIAGKVNIQGDRLGQMLVHQFRYGPEEGETRSEEVDIESGQRGDMWIGLDRLVDIEQARLWKQGNQLGTLILPVTAGKITTEIQVRL